MSVLKRIFKKTVPVYILIAVLVLCQCAVWAAEGDTDSDSAAAVALKTAIDAYEQILEDESGTIYTDMSAAYTAYCEAVRLYDRYYYGGNLTEANSESGAYADTNSSYSRAAAAVTDEEMQTAAEALTTATQNLTEWTAYTANATAAYDNSYTKDTLVSALTVTGVNATDTNSYAYNSAKNGNSSGQSWTVKDELSSVLWTYGVGPGASSTYLYNTVDYPTGYSIGVMYGPIVYMYDGETAMACPVNMFHKNGVAGTTLGVSYIGTSGPVTMRPVTTGFTLNHIWHGHTNSDKSDYYGYAKYDTSGTYLVWYAQGYLDSSTTDATGYTDNKNLIYSKSGAYYYVSLWEYMSYYSNTLYVDSTAVDSDSYVTNYDLTWRLLRWSANSTASNQEYQVHDFSANAENRTLVHNSKTVSDTNSRTDVEDGSSQAIYIVNYKKLLDALDYDSTGSYSEGGLAAIFGYIDAATAIDPNSYFKDTTPETLSADVSAVNTALETAGTNLAGAAATADKYNDLRAALKEANEIYDTYKDDPYSTFCKAEWDSFVYRYTQALYYLDYGAVGTTAGKYYTTAATTITNYTTYLTERIAELETGHTLEYVDETGATCTANGVAGHYKCTNQVTISTGRVYTCDFMSADADGKTELTDDDIVISAATHTEENVTLIKGAANCVEAGYPNYWHCSACGGYFSTDPTGTTDIGADSFDDLGLEATGTDPTNHKGAIIYVPYTAPTDEQAGNRAYYYCEACGQYNFAEDMAEDSNTTHGEVALYCLNVTITADKADGSAFIVTLTDEYGNEIIAAAAAAQGENGQAAVTFAVGQGTYTVSVDGEWSHTYVITAGDTSATFPAAESVFSQIVSITAECKAANSKGANDINTNDFSGAHN